MNSAILLKAMATLLIFSAVITTTCVLRIVMSKISLFLMVIFLSACTSISIPRQCKTPSFIAADTFSVSEYFLTEGLFYKYCPIKTPKEFTYTFEPNLELSVRLSRGWLYLRAVNERGSVSIYAEGLRFSEHKGFTHVISVESLKDKRLSLVIDGTVNFESEFNLIDCTCMVSVGLHDI
ncbi:MAG: hypothetical protein ACI9D5_000512 [Candidatus Endobugula sp.]|jgi:hypothetical protein